MTVAIGLDIGTTSTIATLMDETGKVIASHSRPSRLSSIEPGFAEADPAQWWQNSQAVLKAVMAELPQDASLCGVCVTGMLPAVVLLDEKNEVLRPSIQQSDARCGQQVETMKESLDEADFLARTGQGLTQQLVAPKLRWLEAHEPDIHTAIRCMFGSYDYINFCLTGVKRVERNWALEAGFVDLKDHQIAADLVALGGLDKAVLPDLAAAHEVIGTVSQSAADLTGLPVGCPVFGGAADHIGSALATGLTKPGDVLLKFGGAGDVIAIAEQAMPDRRLFLDYHLIPGLYAPNGCMASSGSMLRWLAGILSDCPGEEADLAKLDAKAAQKPLGADGVRMLPYFLGEKTPIHDPKARGTLTGLSLGHDQGHIWRAALEAIACGFKHHLDVLEDMGTPARQLFASDGGSRSAIWMQIVADICAAPVKVLADAFGSSTGAAWVALVGAGICDWPDVAGAVAYGKIYEPSDADADTAKAVYADYHALYAQLRPFFGSEEAQ
nr:FGGY family carbohydrate kinase [uncultured Cohaesibacter sp.]